MKAFNSVRLSGMNFLIYVFLVFLAFASLWSIWGLTNMIFIHPDEVSHFDNNPHTIHPAKNVFVDLNWDVLKSDPTLYRSVQKNETIFKALKGLILCVLTFFLILQLKTLLNSLKNKTFFIRKNLSCVRNISYLLGLWLVIEFILYQCFQLFIPFDLIRENWNYIPVNKGIISGLLLSVDFIKLLAAFAFYVVAVVFEEGNQLKKESELTI